MRIERWKAAINLFLLGESIPMVRLLVVIGLLVIAVALGGLMWLLIRIPKRKSIKAAIIIGAMITAFPIVLLIAQSLHELHMMIRGRNLAARLEHYRVSHGQYPIALSQMGIDETKVGIFYQRDYASPSVFYLWFNTGFGTVSQYDSQTGTWHGPR
jgi:hypothetical protein